MTPLSFLEFRDYLFPASGFQSLQFRLIENKLGLKRDNRLLLGQKTSAHTHTQTNPHIFFSSEPNISIFSFRYEKALKPEHRSDASEAEESKTLYELVERWLERLHLVSLFHPSPQKVDNFKHVYYCGGCQVDSPNFNFWQEYKKSVKQMFQDDRKHVRETVEEVLDL